MGPISAQGFIDSVVVQWESLTEFDIMGYNVERASSDGPWTQVNGVLVRSEGGQPMGDSYNRGYFCGSRDHLLLPPGVNRQRLDPDYHDPYQVTVPIIGEPA